MKTRTLYILGSILVLILAGLSAITPNFSGDSQSLAGNLKQVLLGGKNVITYPTQNINITANDVVTFEWKAEEEKADLYLVPEAKELKLVTIAKEVTGYSFTYVVPNDLKTGAYRLVVSAGEQIKSQARIMVTEEASTSNK